MSFPTPWSSWYSDDYKRLNHGEEATRSLMMMDAVPAAAEGNGLPVNLKRVFLAPSGFTVGGLRLAHDRPVDARTLVSGSNKGAFFFCGNRARGLSIDKCRFDFEGGIGIDIQASPSWRFTRNHAGPQKYLLFVNGASDFGLYEGNAGRMGFVGLKINGVDSQIFDDYIKTAPLARRGPRFCTVRDNRFINDTRDGPDGTGGFYGWLFEGNYFEVGFAGIDIKTSFRNASDLGYFTRDYCGVVIRNNVFVGCGIVYTTSWSESGVGLPYDEDWAVRDIVCDGNIYWPRLGKNTVAHYSKSTHRITSQNEIFRSWEGTPAGDWDASTGSFPSGAVANSFYTVSVAGTVDGISFGVNQSVYARIDDAATDTYAGNWFRTPNGHSRIGIQMLKVDDNSAAGILPRNIQMQGIRWDARGSPTMQLNGTSYVQIGGTNIQITGTVRALDKTAHMVGDSDVFGLAGARNVRFDLECHHEGTQTRGALVMVQANSHDIWIDGQCENLAELVVAWGATIDGLHLGKRSGLRLSGVGTILAGAGVNRNVFSGALETGGGPVPDHAGKPRSRTAEHRQRAGGRSERHHPGPQPCQPSDRHPGSDHHRRPGDAGWRPPRRPAGAARAACRVVRWWRKRGIGNLILPEDRALSDPEATLIVEKRGTDWYEVSFSPA
ncbi:hypothetical protein [Rhodophyticola sp.]|uniref:hypothetical protein n=1 Tax=Rhodophyticola sp. TaxID=2680032 RepID=UPI003D2A080B